ncbi:SNF5/SMARCB 1/INI1 family protein [Ceratobasidium sp. AG-Ba]|nr:SNF5/SMARCB 1/INI1 family protein [Ceratobasidium sp. AG-Ba]QRW15014.1 SNF5/SMARCB 1/INI1 family protein [Ceratobasidium sp. AG-Ba]
MPYPAPPSSHVQATYTAYYSRLRTGSTLLMQPIGLAPVPPNHNPSQPPPALSHTASFGPSRRTRGGVVNYAEMEEDDDDHVEVDGEPSSAPSVAAPAAASTARAAGELDRSYLGTIPPTKFIQAIKANRTQQQYFSESRLAEAASKRAVYIPIRIELNTETHQIRDSFLWNINETLISPTAFAQQLCLDLGLPPNQHVDLITAAISAQCEEHRWIAGVPLRHRRKRKGLTDDESNTPIPELSNGQRPPNIANSSEHGASARDPRIESLRAELNGVSISPRSNLPGSGTGNSTPGAATSTPGVATSAASPTTDGPATPAPIAVNIDDESDPLNAVENKTAETSAAPAQNATPSDSPAPGTLPASQGLAKLDNGPIDGSESEVDSDSDYETDTDVEEPDCRVIVNLDLQISTHHLHDHIEWDLASPLTPEHFARVLCADTGLAGEAVPLVACALREALLKHTKDAVEAGLVGPGTGDKRSAELASSTTAPLRKELGSEPLRSVFREWQDAEEYFPRLELLSAEELERRAMERERAIRRMRRETQRWGQANVSRKRFRER